MCFDQCEATLDVGHAHETTQQHQAQPLADPCEAKQLRHFQHKLERRRAARVESTVAAGQGTGQNDLALLSVAASRRSPRKEDPLLLPALQLRGQHAEAHEV